MALRFTVLASGSTGNGTIVQTDEITLLVDAGLSAKKLESLMETRGVKGGDLSGILVTHEHSDHIRGLGAVARKYNLPIYANEATWEEMHKQVGSIEPEQRVVLKTGDGLKFGDLSVESYAISHDAAEPVGYCFYEKDVKLSLATDLGYVSDKVMQQLESSDVIVLEANHDIDMLRIGRYPWNIKRRILGDSGHLSNVASGEALSKLMNDRLQRVYLAHISLDHNLIDLAKMTVNNVMEDNGIFYRRDEFELRDTHHDKATPWDEVTRR